MSLAMLSILCKVLTVCSSKCSQVLDISQCRIQALASQSLPPLVPLNKRADGDTYGQEG
ncbi:hypothetical protein I3760_03G244500 [Carya illinoinensis]|nr:hypothetical protein I3760_03G244500 [Carya illinoinensis]